MKKKYGRPINFKYLEDVPVREEVEIIELILDILNDHQIPYEQRAFEAGRLHFRNFSTTPLGRLILFSLPKNIKTVILRSPHIAIHVFKNVKFRTESVSNNAVRIIMENSDYPIDHFKGLFYEWMLFWNYKGEVTARIISPNAFEYTMSWE